MTRDLPAPIPPAARRHALRRLAEVRGLVGDFQRPHQDLQLLASDGVRIEASFLPSQDADAPAPAVVLAHGFAAHRRKPAYAYLADVLSQVAHVLTVDLRGHGRSGGASTLGHDEAYDVVAAVRHLRGEGHERVIAVGSSMGGTSVAHAVGGGLVEVDAAVLISAPGWLHDEPRTDPMRELHEWWTVPWRRTAMRLATRARVIEVDRWPKPPHPVDMVPTIGVPLLVVHGDDDPYFPTDEARELSVRAPDGLLWHEPAGFGHAEDGFTREFADALAYAVTTVACEKRFPDRAEARTAIGLEP